MHFKDVVKTGKQNFIFDLEKKVPKEIITSALSDLHWYMPSKQRKMPFHIDVLDWSDPAKRLKIYEHTYRVTPTEDDSYNPQALAPWLLVFSPRFISEKEIDGNNEYREPRYVDQQAHMEIGMASLFLMYIFTSRKLNTGFCRCIKDPHKLAEEVFENRQEITLLLGVGHQADYKDKFLCPIHNVMKPSPIFIEKKKKHPEQNIYVHI
tara:strand:+ start:1245 stop:1868 length:624 start_codon:yes stop_codon:yes gene_type:complete